METKETNKINELKRLLTRRHMSFAVYFHPTCYEVFVPRLHRNFTARTLDKVLDQAIEFYNLEFQSVPAKPKLPSMIHLS